MNTNEIKTILQEAYINFCLAEARATKAEDRYIKLTGFLNVEPELVNEWVEETRLEVVKLSIEEDLI